MVQAEFLHEFRQLTLHQQLRTLKIGLEIVEANIRNPVEKGDTRLPLADAAKVLLNDYMEDGDLTSFTALDGEGIHATW